MWKHILEFALFWWDCILRGSSFGGGIFGLGEMVCASLWLCYRTKGQTEKDKKREEKVREWSKIAFLALFAFTTVIVAPYKKYQEAKRLSSTEVKHDIPYDTVAAQLEEAKKTADAERKRADRAERTLGETTDQLVKNYASTNTRPDPATIQKEIEREARAWAQVAPSNPEYTKLARQHASRRSSLETSKAEAEWHDSLKSYLDPIYPIWVSTISGFRSRLTEHAKRCGGEVSPVSLPSVDDIIYGRQQNVSIMLGTNCAWKCDCHFGRNPVSLFLESKGTDSTIDILQIYSQGGTLIIDVSRKVDGKTARVDSTNCPMLSTSSRVDILSRMLNYIMPE